MSLSSVGVYDAPLPPHDTDLVCGLTDATPFTLGGLFIRWQKYWWSSPEDWHAGRKLLARQGMELLMPCGGDIVNAIDRVYTLLDAGLNGIGRSVSGLGTELDPYVYSPPLEQAADPADYLPGGLRSDANVTRAVLANLVTGALSSVAPGEAIPNQKLEAIYQAVLAMGSEDGPTFEQAAQIIMLLGA